MHWWPILTTPAPTPGLPYDLFAARARTTPDAPALYFSEGECLTYQKLAARVHEVVMRLDASGASQHVGVCLDSGPDAVTAVLAVLASGRAFVPLDPSYPPERIGWMLEDTEANVDLTVRALGDRIPLTSAALVHLDEPPSGNGRLAAPARRPGPEDPACILYTSGSSGRPKGVIRPLRGIVARFEWLHWEPDDVFCHNMSLNVGFSQERLFIPLMLGLPLAVIPRDVYSSPRRFVTSLEAHGVTQLTLTPHTLEQILDVGPDIAKRGRHGPRGARGPVRPASSACRAGERLRLDRIRNDRARYARVRSLSRPGGTSRFRNGRPHPG